MSALSRTRALPRTFRGVSQSYTSSLLSQYGRTAAYRRLYTSTPDHAQSVIGSRAAATTWQSRKSLQSLQPIFPAASSISRRSISYRDIKKGKDSDKEAEKATPRAPKQEKGPEPAASTKADAGESADTESAAERAYREAREESEKEEAKQQRTKSEEEGESDDGAKSEEKQKKNAPPPPPHGNKTPWQVFTETLSTEFKASKEWNEGTKELAGSVHDFTQNPNVQKARSAYNKATDTAATASTAALKTTATAIGSSAAWVWDTTPVKGVRHTVNAVGSGVEKVTRPVRETEAYRNVKEVIDDGSSTRYGGWTEKEERRKRREAKELRRASQGGRRPTEPMEEDPK